MKTLFRRWLGIGLLVLTTVAINETAFAALNLYEPFNYTAGQGLAGQSGQSGAAGNTPPSAGGSGTPFNLQAPNGNYWMTAGYGGAGFSPYSQTNDAVTVAADLSYSGLANPISGGSIELGGTGTTPRIAFTPIDANPNYNVDFVPVNAYYSFLFQIHDMSSTAAIGGMIGAFNNTRGSQSTNPSTVGTGVFAKASANPGKFFLGVAEDTTVASSATYDTANELSFDTTYLVVGRYTIRGTSNTGGTGGTSDDTMQIWINPTSLGGAEPAGAIVAAANSIDVPTNLADGSHTIQSFIFRQDATIGANSPTDYLIDDLRIGTTYADVTPVPVVGVDGDYNGNGVVDAADYVAWKKGGTLQNEVDTPLTVNAADYTAWRARFGNGGSGAGAGLSSQPVPEPATIVLFAGFVLSFCCRRQLS